MLWEWRGGRKALLKRLLITLVVATISFALTAWLLPNITTDRALDAVFVVIVMAILNAVVRPFVLAFVAPRSLILTAVAVLALQILVFMVAANIVPGVHVGGSPPGPHRVVRLRDHQHDPDGRPGRRQRRLVLRPVDPEHAREGRRGGE